MLRELIIQFNKGGYRLSYLLASWVVPKRVPKFGGNLGDVESGVQIRRIVTL